MCTFSTLPSFELNNTIVFIKDTFPLKIFYTLNINGYYGDAGDALSFHKGQKFSTIDQDNDVLDDTSCSELNKGAWW